MECKPAETASALRALRRSKTVILAAVLVSILTDLVLYGSLLPVLPYQLASSDSGDGRLSLWNSALIACHGTATFVTALPIAMVADYLHSRVHLFRCGLLFSVMGTTLLCIGRPLPMLFLGRALQGMGSSFVWITGLAVLADVFEMNRLGFVLALVEIATSSGAVLGPILGGATFVAGGYRASFAAAFGLLSLDVVLRGFITCDRSRGRTSPADSTAAASGETRTSDLQETSVLDRDVQITSRGPNLGTTVRLLRSSYVQMLVLICLVTSLLQTALDALLPFFVKDVFHWTASGAGCVFLTFTLASIATLAVGKFIDQKGTKWLATCGLIACGPPLILLRMVTENTIGHKVGLCVLLVLIGLCFALIIPPTYKNFAHSVQNLRDTSGDARHPDFAQAYSLVTMAYSGGCLLVFLVTLAEQRWGWVNTVSLLGGISVLTAVPVAIWMDSKTAADEGVNWMPSTWKRDSCAE